MKSTWIFFLILLIGILSCQKDNTELPAPSGTLWKSSTIDKNEIGGQDVTVLTAYNETSLIQSNSFKTLVSDRGCQIVYAIDKFNQLRGLSYSTKENDEVRIQPINAESTAFSFFLLVQGLTRTEPQEVEILKNNLTQISEYCDFKEFVTKRLKYLDLQTIMADSLCLELFQQTISEYADRYMVRDSTQKFKISGYPECFTVSKDENNKLLLSNYGYRYVNVFRAYNDNGNISNVENVDRNMSGMVGFSWGSIFTYGDPSIITDNEYKPPTQSSKTDYWIIGPGRANSRENPPSIINRDYSYTLGLTIFKYVVLPTLDITFGVTSIANLETGKIKDIYDLIKAPKKVLDIMNAETDAQFAAASANYAMALFGALIGNAALVKSLGISSPAAVIVKILLTINTMFSIGNMFNFLNDVDLTSPYVNITIGTIPSPPVLRSPSNGSKNESAKTTFQWEANPIANASYMLQVSNEPDFPIQNLTYAGNIVNVTEKLLNPLEVPKTFYWRVSCTNHDQNETSDWSETWSFTTLNTLEAPALISPKDGYTQLNDRNPNLDWEDVSDALNYTVQVANNTGFSPFEEEEIVNNSQWPASGLDWNTTYYWRVRANNESVSSPWSEVRNFYLLNTPRSIVLSSPSDGSEDNTLTPVLDWEDETVATSYNVQLAQNPSFTPLVDEQVVSSSSWTTPVLNSNTKYYWRVSGFNEAGEGGSSEVWSFQTESNSTFPTASFVVTPESGSTTTNFYFDASGCSDAETPTSQLEVRWDWENDGNWDTNYSTTKTINHGYQEVGSFTIKLEVKDTEGLTGEFTRSISVSENNTNPIASFVVTPESGSTTTNFYFDASGCSDAETPTSQLEVRWDWENDGNWDADYSTNKQLYHRFLTKGTYSIRLEVKDQGDLLDDFVRTVSVTTGGGNDEGTFTDSRDNHEYDYITIGSQTWMAENLKYLPEVSPPELSSKSVAHYYVYDYNGSRIEEAMTSNNYNIYGVLYNMEAANGACPNGWHLPTDQEWKVLETYLGMTSNDADKKAEWRDSGSVGKKLKSANGWENNGNGDDSEGFGAFPAGCLDAFVKSFSLLGRRAYLWSSTPDGEEIGAWRRGFGSDRIGSLRSNENAKDGISVRCIKN
jgi:uncharacterized protein (TIGR02145 family)